MTQLSVNVNKIAVLRNSRGGNEPDVVRAARACLAAGAHVVNDTTGLSDPEMAEAVRERDAHVIVTHSLTGPGGPRTPVPNPRYDDVVAEVHRFLAERIFAAEMAGVAKKNLVVVGWWENGFRHITNSRKPINVPDDLKGLKIRVPEGNVFVETFNSYGASATPMSFGELYSALQLKTVDGQENPTTHVLTQKYYEVQKYLSITNHIHVAEPLLMSAKVYKTLPAEYQKALHEAGKEVAVWMMKEIGSQEAKEIEQIKKRGMLINTADVNAFKEASKKVYA